MPSVSVPLGIAGAGLAGSVISGGASKSAASQQANAANEQALLQMQMFEQTQGNLAPYMGAGVNALNNLQIGLGFSPGGTAAGPSGSLLRPFQPTMAQLAQTPGYQFTLGQGLEAAQNGFAAQGLGTSGAAIKGAANYAEGLASTTYQQQFQNYQAQNQQAYNMLGGLATTGQNAAAGLGGLGLQAAGQAGQGIMAAGNAGAAGTVGAANALNAGIGSLGSTALLYGLAPGMFGGGGGAGAGNGLNIDTMSGF